MTDHRNSMTDALLAAIKTRLNHDNDEVALEFLSCTVLDSVIQMMDEEFAGMARNEQHSVVAALIAKLGQGDGIEFKSDAGGGDTGPVWLRVTPAVEGRLPSTNPADRRWIRLDTITAVIPVPTTFPSADPQDWMSSLEVQSGGATYHASAVRFRGLAVEAATDKVLNAVARMVRPTLQRQPG